MNAPKRKNSNTWCLNCMARACAICGKKKNIGNRRRLLRGHRNVTAKRSFRPNLQKTTYRGQPVLACVSCIKTQTKASKIF